MEILIGLGLAVLLLYGWLTGHWFARVLMFLILAPLLLWLGGGAGFAISGDPVAATAVGILCAVGSWFAAALPTYYWRHQMRIEHEAATGGPSVPYRRIYGA